MRLESKEHSVSGTFWRFLLESRNNDGQLTYNIGANELINVVKIAAMMSRYMVLIEIE